MRYRALLWGALFLLLTPRLASATSCAEPIFDESFESADVVFMGTADRVVPTSFTLLAHFSVSSVFKGQLPARVSVQGGGMPGAHFEAKRRYLVFARLMADKGAFVLHAHLCGGTVEASLAPVWVERLGTGHAPKRGAIVAGKRDDPVPGSPVSHDPAPDEPTASPVTSAPDATAPLEPTETARPPGPSEQPTAVAPRASRGGCAGCATHDALAPHPGWLFAALALAALAALRFAR
jgi:hypothetical protein